jgi:Glycosyl transferases group 1
MTEYRKWRARGALLSHTAATSLGAIPRALSQSAVAGEGLNFLTYSRGTGLSMADLAGLIRQGLDASGLPVANHVFTTGGPSAGEEPSAREVYGATVALVQSGHIPTAAIQCPRLFAPRRFKAAVVHYELREVPFPQRVGIPFLDQIWTTSRFVQEAFARCTRKPVHVLPVPIVASGGVGGRMRDHLGLGAEYLFGYQFDLASSGERKYPQAVAAAYMRAFPQPEGGVRLLLKSAHASSSPAVWADLNRQVDGRPDIMLVDDYWATDVIDAFFLDIDCYVSLHRAEGFGITIAKAMAAGKPVVATAYSGNVDLMNDMNSIGVPFRLVRVGENPIYPPSGYWAEPDTAFAADALRQLVTDPEAGREMGRRARAEILTERTPQRTGAWLRERLPSS